MGAIPTIKVQDGAGGFFVINASDFDEKVHKVYSDKAPAKVASDTPAPEAPAKPKAARKPRG